MKKWFVSKGITWRKPFLTEVPVLLMVFGKSNEPYWIQSVWLAIGYLILALEEKGLASLTYTPSNVLWANELLNVPKEYVLQAIIPIGKHTKLKISKVRLELNDILYCNKWKQSCVEWNINI